MNDHKTLPEKLPVLNDDPLFWGSEEFDRNQDAFNHEAYAKAIFNILVENNPPLLIGLFCAWDWQINSNKHPFQTHQTI